MFKFYHPPCQDTHGVYSARSFVEWYNGLPASREVSVEIFAAEIHKNLLFFVYLIYCHWQGDYVNTWQLQFIGVFEENHKF